MSVNKSGGDTTQKFQKQNSMKQHKKQEVQ